MSRGHGELERHILGTLAKYPILQDRRIGVVDLARGYQWQATEGDQPLSASVLSSIRRGLRNLQAAGKVESIPNTGGTSWHIANHLLVTAIHEAGHAVIARKLGVGLKAATVKGDDKIAGAVNAMSPAKTKSQHAKAVIWTLAGRAAVSYAVSKNLIGLHDTGHGASIDNEHVRHSIGMVIGEKTKCGSYVAWKPEIAAYREKAVKESEKLVRKHWAAIEDVACELIERTTLTGDEIDARIAATEAGDRYKTPFFRKLGY